MTKKRHRKIELKKMSRDCWALDYAFVKWLYPRLEVYKKDASKLIDLEFPHRFTYNGKDYTQLELINMLISLCDFYLADYLIGRDNIQDILNLWAIIAPAMWW